MDSVIKKSKNTLKELILKKVVLYKKNDIICLLNSNESKDGAYEKKIR